MNIPITEIALSLWVVCAVLIVFTKKMYRIIITFGVFSLIGALSYLFLGSPDVAMAEAAVSAFVTIFFIVCIERYYKFGMGLEDEQAEEKVKFSAKSVGRILAPTGFCVGLFWLAMQHLPMDDAVTVLRDQYLARFMYDVGGMNAVASIVLGYRVYDTLFEALLLVVSVVAVAHVSWYDKAEMIDRRHSEIKNSGVARFTMRVVCPIIIIFGAYIIANGHLTAGGGFQGGLAIATFFICRYLVYDINDLPIAKVMRMEKLVFVNITILPVLAVFTGVTYFATYILPLTSDVYLVAMNILIGFKVACGFFVLFYRFVAIERW
ncbi:MAG: DUF4040 domain-containing protein [Defluviitaleaceae bacterium]|nr:DUF4040 domain-containing protein [Defluviitaleaceae bacterium]